MKIMNVSDSIELHTSVEDIFPILQQAIISTGHTIKTIVPNQTVVSEGSRDFSWILMVVLILFFIPGAIVYYFISKRRTLSVIVTKHNETGCKVNINSDGCDGDKTMKAIFYDLQNYSKKPETSKEEKDE